MEMHISNPDMEHYLEQLARGASPGDQLPTIRELMRGYGVSQIRVQRAFQSLKARGLIESQVGRGTYFRGAADPAATAPRHTHAPVTGGRAPASAVKSVLLLRRSISIARGRVLLEGLQRRLAAEGHRVLELSYTDPDHALVVLKGLPRFDACVVQSSYKTIPIALLAALKDKSDVVAVDGAVLVGADVESVGTEWGEPLAEAVDVLQRQGHRRIGFAVTSLPFLATQLARRRFDRFRETLSGVELQELAIPFLPDGDYVSTLVGRLKASLDESGQLPFTGLVVWGVEDGARLLAELSQAGMAVPQALSVVLLGRVDLANEHADFFHTVGCRVSDQIDGLHQAIHARWSDPSAPHGIHLIPVAARTGQSVAPPANG
ncbi:GntR family transcriptional regulator [Hydrogenophaga sp. A37]|uniref:GntR family transcriptional regulator n=1 Tax=Hydrogenophaga sp. A37 TaxID=1945864 RepID=UPI0009879C0F|nr:GntR family transcriptional regulator [Hydrogenophaga sp. A37]OOG79663.1 GntR family transcriptional regulator [Hydrogenophaga sp. A37]